VERSAQSAGLKIHDLPAELSRVETLLVRRSDKRISEAMRRFQQLSQERA
jgi:hypothetical protein